MRPETWERLEAVFFRALDLPPDERTAFLDQACGDDAELRREAGAVLAAHVAAGGTGDSDRLLTPSAGDGFAELPQGTRIGVYELEAVIGRGGMGEVYRARRADAQYEQRVAVKLMRPGRDTAELMRRFRTERQILARLQHPGIATLLDGGVTESGRPFLVMQYVDGVPITTFANDRGLDLGRRLRLFGTVCDAVQFAHANLVVHRDLKPGNILVTGQGEVRLLDFGIAKLLDLEATDGSTTGDLLLLTPEHAAPEQFLGGAITTATDVYALGVLLYELVTGFRPFQLVSPVELPRAVCQQDPRAPSSAAADRTARARIAGDLDSIVLKALRKEPERRYGSVAELADDVRRHLNGFPVQARPETFGYVASRYLKRHRVGILASAALAIALVTLAIVSVRFAVTSRAQARAVAQERDVAVEVSSFLEHLFKAPDPFAAGDDRRDTLRIRDFLDEATLKVRTELSGQPLVQARLLTVLGQAYRNLGQLPAALSLLEEAATIRRRDLGPGATETAQTEVALGQVLLEQGEAARAESLFRASEASFALDSVGLREERANALGSLGNALQTQGKFPEAEQVYRSSAQLFEAEFGPEDHRVAESLSNLATALMQQARDAEAEPLLRRAVALWRAGLGNDHPLTATGLNVLANLVQNRRDLEEAETLYREALAIRRARFKDPHPAIAFSINNLAALMVDKEDLPAAESLFRETLAMRRALFGENHQAVGIGLMNLASTLARLGRRPEAAERFLEARKVLIAGAGPDHPLVGDVNRSLGNLYHDAGHHDKALDALAASLAIRRARLAPTHPKTATILSDIGRCLTDVGRHREAEDRLLESFGMLEPRRKDEPKQWAALLDRMARLYRATGREAEAMRYEAMETE